MTKEIAQNNNALATTDEAHLRRDQIKSCKRLVNESLLAIGKLLEEGHIKQDWTALGYESEADWITDPHGIDMRQRTARAFRRIYRLYVNRLAKLNVKEEDLITIDHCKLEAMASKIENEPDDDKAIELLEKARTLTLRMIIDDHEEETYITFTGRGKVHRWLNEKAGMVIHLSGVQPTIDTSAQSWAKVFYDDNPSRIVEIRVRCKKER